MPCIKGSSDGRESSNDAPVWARSGPGELDEAHEGTTVRGFSLPFEETTVADCLMYVRIMVMRLQPGQVPVLSDGKLRQRRTGSAFLAVCILFYTVPYRAIPCRVCTASASDMQSHCCACARLLLLTLHVTHVHV